MTAEPDELFLIDGNSLAYRAFFALPDTIARADGFPTNALYGLAAMMVKVVAEERPGRVVVAWDGPSSGIHTERTFINSWAMIFILLSFAHLLRLACLAGVASLPGIRIPTLAHLAATRLISGSPHGSCGGCGLNRS